MKKTLRSVPLLAIIALAAGCASDPDKMATSYVSPMQYKNHDCDQIASELQRVTRRTTELYGSLDQMASRDAAQMGVGLVLFWPALLFLEGGDGPEAAEYSRLKGERDALEQAAIQNKCDPAIIPPVVKPPEPKHSSRKPADMADDKDDQR